MGKTRNPEDNAEETRTLEELIEGLAGRVRRSFNKPELDQAIEQIGAALTLYETLMPEDVPSSELHGLFQSLKDARDREMEGPRGRGDKRPEAEKKTIMIAAVRYFSDGSSKPQDISNARKRVAGLLGSSTGKLKRIETQWAKRQSRATADALPVSRGTLVPEKTVETALKMIHQAVSHGADPDVFIREFFSE